MTAKQWALADIQLDLASQKKDFIPFKEELNTVMRKIVSQHITEQRSVNMPFNTHSKASSQLVAHCFFSHGEVKYDDYTKYYTQW